MEVVPVVAAAAAATVAHSDGDAPEPHSKDTDLERRVSFEPNQWRPYHHDQQNEKVVKKKHYMVLLVINYAFLFVGSVSSTLLSKFYFVHKGSNRWVSTVVQCAGFPLLLPSIFLPYYLRSRSRSSESSERRRPFDNFTPNILYQSVLVGIMLGINNLLFSWGNSYLPVSTSSLLLSSQLAFTLILSVLLVKQKINFSNLNCVVLLTLTSLLLAFTSSGDRPPGLTRAQYFAGFACTVGAGLLFALYLPLMEKIYRRVDCYEMVMEMQVVMEVAATGLALIGMAVDGGYGQMVREGKEVFNLGYEAYWWTLLGNVVTWQLCFLGTAGMVFLTTGITGGICMTALMGINVVGGVVVYKDEFGGVKGVATFLCLWGFCSYVYGMYTDQAKKKDAHGEEDDDGDEQKQQSYNTTSTATATATGSTGRRGSNNISNIGEMEMSHVVDTDRV